MRRSVNYGWGKNYIFISTNFSLKFGASCNYEGRPETLVVSPVPEIFVTNRNHRYFHRNLQSLVTSCCLMI